jgi:hypothetical protein
MFSRFHAGGLPVKRKHAAQRSRQGSHSDLRARALRPRAGLEGETAAYNKKTRQAPPFFPLSRHLVLSVREARKRERFAGRPAVPRPWDERRANPEKRGRGPAATRP